MFVAAVLLAAAPLGCTASRENAPLSAGGPDTFVESEAGPILDARWPFWPEQMRIHPLTMRSVDPDSGRPIIEARIELTDSVGDTTKCVAQFRLELYEGEPRNADDAAVSVWNADLRDLETNRLHYDKVTQTYLFRLGFDEQAPEFTDPWLRVYVLSVTGRKFESTSKVR